jgi:hypothetical protein
MVIVFDITHAICQCYFDFSIYRLGCDCLDAFRKMQVAGWELIRNLLDIVMTGFELENVKQTLYRAYLPPLIVSHVGLRNIRNRW